MTEQVLVTGIDGFIGKHVALELLRRGYRVRGTLLDANRAKRLGETLARHGADPSGIEFRQADLLGDADWSAHVADCAYVLHIASPFPAIPPSDREALVPAARGGALKVAEAAFKQGVKKVVVTSSLVAMMYRPGRPRRLSIGEADWSDPEWKALSAYMVSKTRAERALWERAADRDAVQRVTTVNPALVLGPALDEEIGASLSLIRMILGGENPALTPTAHAVVDVRDVAELHVQAMLTEDAGGRRLIASGGTITVAEMAERLLEAVPERKDQITTRVLPNFGVRLLALVVPALRPILPDLGIVPGADTDYVTALTGVTFRSPLEAVESAGRSLVAYGVV